MENEITCIHKYEDLSYTVETTRLGYVFDLWFNGLPIPLNFQKQIYFEDPKTKEKIWIENYGWKK